MDFVIHWLWYLLAFVVGLVSGLADHRYVDSAHK